MQVDIVYATKDYACVIRREGYQRIDLLGRICMELGIECEI